MLLDMIIMMFTFFGFMFILPIPMLLEGMEPWDQFPWGIIGVIFFVCEIGIIRWRGAVSTYWKVVDFPSPGVKIGLTNMAGRIIAEYILPSPIKTMIRTKDSRFYRDNPDGGVNIGGHDGRQIDYEVAYCIAQDQAHLVEDLDAKGFYTLEDVKEWIINKMCALKNKAGHFILAHQDDSALIPQEIDIQNNKIHRMIFDKIADKFFIKAHGRVYTLKHYHRFQEKQAPPVVIGTIVHYIKALAYMRAVRIKKNVGGGGKALGWLILALIIIAVIVLFLFGTGILAI